MQPSFSNAGREVGEIAVRINYDIIRLFSEGLYSSPHKAIEELVSNSYDAGAESVHILLPEPASDADGGAMDPLWAIDNGHGMDESGFRQLWRIADSNKESSRRYRNRPPIGQFGIGKLAAYVLAWNLTHVSRTKDKLLLTTMNFERVEDRQADEANPVQIALREIEEEEAKRLLANIEIRDPLAWKLLFGGDERAETWTVAALSNFKDMYKKLQSGTLRWVLSTALPLKTDFGIWLDGERVTSSKEGRPAIHTCLIDKNLPGVGAVKGEASIYEDPLDRGKSDKIGRSYGFFIRVRGRIINLDDDTFGMNPFNHAAWSRFEMEVDVDGLREHLLSSREGVRDSDDIREFRGYIHGVFNEFRTEYEKWARRNIEIFDIAQIIESNEVEPTRLVDPIFRSVSDAVETESETFYVDAPKSVSPSERSAWLESYESQISDGRGLFAETVLEGHGEKAPAIRYDPSTRKLSINSNHPFIDKVVNLRSKRDIARIFAFSEVLIEGQLLERGMDRVASSNFLVERDYALRLIAGGMSPPTARSVLRQLEHANETPERLEVATGLAFQALGFEYQRAGGRKSGTDGILYAQLGRHKDRLADYKAVYDAKQTNSTAVPAGKIDFGTLTRFIKETNADYGFFIAAAYQGENDENGALNSKLKQPSETPLILLKVEHLRRLVSLHFKYGVTLTDVRELLDKTRSVPEVCQWLDGFEESLIEKGEVPVQVLLEGIEQEKRDVLAIPNVNAVRARTVGLEKFSPEHLVAKLKAVESIVGSRWIEVSRESAGVHMHQTAEQILNVLDRNLGELDLSAG